MRERPSKPAPATEMQFPAFQWVSLTIELILFVTLLDFELLYKNNKHSKPKKPSSIHYKTRHRDELYQWVMQLHIYAKVFHTA